MDPLSFTASLVAVTTVTQQVGKKLNDLRKIWRDAPHAVCALNNELSNLQLVLQLCEGAFNTLSETVGLPLNVNINVAETCLAELRSHLQGLNDLLDSVLNPTAAETNSTFGPHLKAKSRLSWLRRQKDIANFQKQIRCSKEKLEWIFRASQTSVNAHIYASVDGLALEYAQFRSQTQNALTSIRQAIEVSHDNTKPIICADTKDVATSDGITSASSSTTVRMQHRRHEGNVSTKGRISPHPILEMQIASIRKTCNAFCICRCHKSSRFTSSGMLLPLLGALSTTCNAVPGLASSCSELSCQGRTSSRITLTYRFPPWISARAAIAARASWDASRGPELLLRMPSVIPDSSPAWYYCKRGSARDMQHLFQSGEASPWDQDTCGISLLSCAMAIFLELEESIELVRLLITNGADIDQVDDTGDSPRRCAIELNLLYPETGSPFADLIPWHPGDADDYLEWSPLHELVYKANATDLERQLALSTEHIHSRDSLGQTPLHFAVLLHRTVCANILLHHGANPLLVDNRGCTSLHIAAFSDYDVFSLTNSYCESIEQRNRDGQTALSFACGAYPGDPRIFEALLGRGTYVDARNDLKQTPLILAATSGQSKENLQTLLDWGADIDAQDATGQPALWYAVIYNRLSLISFLLDRRASHKLHNVNDYTFMHTIADYGSLAALEILLVADLSGVDVDALNGEGYTATDKADWRRREFDDNTSWWEWRDKFDQLMRKVRRDTLESELQSGAAFEGLGLLFESIELADRQVQNGIARDMPGTWRDWD